MPVQQGSVPAPPDKPALPAAARALLPVAKRRRTSYTAPVVLRFPQASEARPGRIVAVPDGFAGLSEYQTVWANALSEELNIMCV